MKQITKKFKFTGRVLPEHRQFSLSERKILTFAEPNGFKGLFELTFSDSVVEIFANVEGSDDLHEWALVRAYELATTIVDSHNFTLGHTLRVLLDYSWEKNVRTPIILSHPSVRHLISKYTDIDLELLQEALFADLNIRLALRDLVSSLETMNYSAIAGARAIEAIRNKFCTEGMKEKACWECLRHALNLSRGYIQLISDASTKPRHGKRGDAFNTDQSEITHRAWIIMDRYFQFILRGHPNTLCETEFPIL